MYISCCCCCYLLFIHSLPTRKLPKLFTEIIENIVRKKFGPVYWARVFTKNVRYEFNRTDPFTTTAYLFGRPKCRATFRTWRCRAVEIRRYVTVYVYASGTLSRTHRERLKTNRRNRYENLTQTQWFHVDSRLLAVRFSTDGRFGFFTPSHHPISNPTPTTMSALRFPIPRDGFRRSSRFPRFRGERIILWRGTGRILSKRDDIL